MRRPPSDIAAYLAPLPKDQRAALLDLRRTILTAAPDATERISYRIPSFFCEGGLLSIAAFRNHCSLFAGYVGADLAQAHGGITVVASTIRFTPDKPLPKSLVRRIVRARLRDNRERAKRRASKHGRTSSAKRKVR